MSDRARIRRFFAITTTLAVGLTMWLAPQSAWGLTTAATIGSTAIIAAEPNRPPRANNDTYATIQNTPLDRPRPGVLSNDSDPDGGSDLPQAVAKSDITRNGGKFMLRIDGAFTYEPRRDYVGLDTVTYTIRDRLGATSSPATVVFEVVRNRPPVAKDDTYSTFRNEPLEQRPPGILSNDADPDGSSEFLEVVPQNVTITPNGGTFRLRSDGSFRYVPRKDYTGTDTVTYTIRDRQGAVSAPATIAVAVNPNFPPVANYDDYPLVFRNRTRTEPSPGVLRNDTDPNGTGEGITAVARTVATERGGTFTLRSDGSSTYTPPRENLQNYFVRTYDSVTYTIRDRHGASSEPATINFTIVWCPFPGCPPE